MIKNHKLLLAGGLVAAMAASGGAFTAGLGGMDTGRQLASGTTSVENAVVQNVNYQYANAADGSGVKLNDVVVRFQGADVTTSHYRAFINGGTTTLTVTSATLTAGANAASTTDDYVDVSFDAADLALSGVTSLHLVVDDAA